MRAGPRLLQALGKILSRRPPASRRTSFGNAGAASIRWRAAEFGFADVSIFASLRDFCWHGIFFFLRFRSDEVSLLLSVGRWKVMLYWDGDFSFAGLINWDATSGNFIHCLINKLYAGSSILTYRCIFVIITMRHEYIILFHFEWIGMSQQRECAVLTLLNYFLLQYISNIFQ